MNRRIQDGGTAANDGGGGNSERRGGRELSRQEDLAIIAEFRTAERARMMVVGEFGLAERARMMVVRDCAIHGAIGPKVAACAAFSLHFIRQGYIIGITFNQEGDGEI